MKNAAGVFFDLCLCNQTYTMDGGIKQVIFFHFVPEYHVHEQKVSQKRTLFNLNSEDTSNWGHVTSCIHFVLTFVKNHHILCSPCETRCVSHTRQNKSRLILEAVDKKEFEL